MCSMITDFLIHLNIVRKSPFILFIDKQKGHKYHHNIYPKGTRGNMNVSHSVVRNDSVTIHA